MAADIINRYLCVGGAMALLLAKVDPDKTFLVGRWRRETMLGYLHTTMKSFTYRLLVRMIQHGNYTLILPAHSGL